MEGVRSRPFDWRLLMLPMLALVAAYSVLHIAHLVPMILWQPVPTDWEQHRIAADRIASGASPYFVEDWYRFRWSPVGAWLMVPLTALGPWAWMAAQFASLVTLPRKFALVTLLAFPFWADVQAGNIMTFTFVAAYHALRGNRLAAGLLLGIALIVPRPLLIPLVVYLFWLRPGWRIWFAVAALMSLIGAVVTGYHAQWFEMLLMTGTEESHRFGAHALPGWPFTGLGLAATLTILGYPAVAGFAVQPYWLAYYGLMPLLDWRMRGRRWLTPSQDLAP